MLTSVRRMSTALVESFKATAGKTITCKAAVAWEPKKPLDVTDIQVERNCKSLKTASKTFKVLFGTNIYISG